MLNVCMLSLPVRTHWTKVRTHWNRVRTHWGKVRIRWSKRSVTGVAGPRTGAATRQTRQLPRIHFYPGRRLIPWLPHTPLSAPGFPLTLMRSLISLLNAPPATPRSPPDFNRSEAQESELAELAGVMDPQAHLRVGQRVGN